MATPVTALRLNSRIGTHGYGSSIAIGRAVNLAENKLLSIKPHCSKSLCFIVQVGDIRISQRKPQNIVILYRYIPEILCKLPQ
jgi:hypothetical protein